MDIIQKLEALYNTLDSTFIIGIENQAKIVGVANGLRSMIAEIRQEQKNAAKQEAEQAAAKLSEKGGGPKK